jgi:hypothetical protein
VKWKIFEPFYNCRRCTDFCTELPALWYRHSWEFQSGQLQGFKASIFLFLGRWHLDCWMGRINGLRESCTWPLCTLSVNCAFIVSSCWVHVIVDWVLGPVQTMSKSRGEASLFWTKLCGEEKSLGWKKYIKIIHCQILNILNEKKVLPLDGSLGQAFCSIQTLLERPNSWRHNFLKVLPPRLFWRRRPLDFGL